MRDDLFGADDVLRDVHDGLGAAQRTAALTQNVTHITVITDLYDYASAKKCVRLNFTKLL